MIQHNRGLESGLVGRIKIVRGVTAELHADDKVWSVVINVVADEIYETAKLRRAIVRVEPNSIIDAPDGLYELRFAFDGRIEIRRIRVQRGDLLSKF